MRPIKLTLAGFTSFRTQQTLDFTSLDLFAITGPTGAGKSSLLDAMTYALYGRIPRQAKTEELVSQGATEFKISFHFAINQTEYQITRSWRYRPSTPDNKVILDRWQNDKWERCDRSVKIEDILRMDFNTFTNVILLPQGQFDEFLKGEAKDRRILLTKLTGFTIFEGMREVAGIRYREAKTQNEAIAQLLTNIQAPTIAEVEAQQAQFDRLAAEIPVLVATAINAQKLLDDEERLLIQIQRREALEKEVAELAKQAEAIATFQERWQQAQAASQLAGNWILVQQTRDRAVKAENDRNAAIKPLAIAQDQLAIAEQELEKQRIHHAEMMGQLATRESNLATAKAYQEQCHQYQQDVDRAASALKLKKAELTTAEKELNTAHQQVEKFRQQLTDINTQIAQFYPGGDRLNLLERIAPQLSRWQVAVKPAQATKKKWEKAVKEREKAEKECITNKHQLEQAITVWQTAKDKLQAATEKNTLATNQQFAASLRSHLETGDICPVCGGNYADGNHLPELPENSTIDLTILQEAIALAESSLEVAKTNFHKIEATFAALQQKELECRQEWDSSEAELAQCCLQLSTLLETDNWEAAALVQERTELVASYAQYQEAGKAQLQAAAELEKIQQSLDFATKIKDQKFTEVQIATEELTWRQEALTEVETKLQQLTGGKSWETLQQALQKEKQELARQWQAAETAESQARNQVIKLTETARQAQTTLEQARQQKEQLEINWIAALTTANFTEDSFQKAQATAEEQEKWRQAIATFQDSQIALSSRLAEVERSIDGRMTNQEAIAQYRQAKLVAEAQVNQANHRQTELTTWLQIAADKQQQSQQLLTQQIELQTQEQTYHTLWRNLHSDEFQDYILEHFQVELVARATVLLKDLTDARYSLKIQDGEYCVEDNWNGGETRRIRTLSGGETFATSLSMALALSEKLSMGAELGSLFLDEGFGTLDSSTLESVAQILESLRQQDRLIGIITHIPALAERLPTQVKVRKSPEGSQLVIESL